MRIYLRPNKNPNSNLYKFSTVNLNYAQKSLDLTFPSFNSLVLFPPLFQAHLSAQVFSEKPQKNKNRTEGQRTKRIQNHPHPLSLLPHYFQYPFPATRTSIYSNSRPAKYRTILSISSAVTPVPRSIVVFTYPPKSAK